MLHDDITPPLKTCTQCGAELPETLEFFPARRLGKNGLHPLCRICVRNYMRGYARERRKRHPEKIAAQAKLDWDRHSEERKATHKKWRDLNKKKLSRYDREYRAAHLSEHAAHQRHRDAAK